MASLNPTFEAFSPLSRVFPYDANRKTLIGAALLPQATAKSPPWATGLLRREFLLDLVDTLRQLVAIPSVNPMAGQLAGPEVGEARLTDYLESLCRGLGLLCQRQTVEPGRDNLLARFEGDPLPHDGGEVILFGAHQDTVPVAGMTIDPFDAEVREGRLYGRGACDVKGGMTALLGALARLIEERPRPRPTIVLACTVNEECGFSGARALARACAEAPSGLLPRRPDAAVIAEPTELQVVVSHKGVVRWRCHACGRAAHSSQPESGENAIYRMARAVTVLERYQREVLALRPRHPLCGRPTLSVGTIRGGVGVNIVPDHCVIEVERRVLPGEEPEKARREVLAYLEGQLGAEAALEHDPPFMEGWPMSQERNGALAERLASAARPVIGRCEPVGVPYGTDAASLAAVGIPTVVFGPGSLAQAHTVDEWLDLHQLQQATEILYRFAGGR